MCQPTCVSVIRAHPRSRQRRRISAGPLTSARILSHQRHLMTVQADDFVIVIVSFTAYPLLP